MKDPISLDKKVSAVFERVKDWSVVQLKKIVQYVKALVLEYLAKAMQLIKKYNTKEYRKLAREKLLYYLKLMKMTALDRYILYRFIMAFLGSLFFFLLIFQLTQIFQDMRWLPQGTDILVLTKYYIFGSMYWLIIFQPFGFLFATVYILSRMAHHHELVAIISTGTSIYRTTLYLVLFTVVYYIFNVTFLMNTVIFPLYQKKIMLAEVVFRKMDLKSLVRLKDHSNFSIFGSNNLIYIVGHFNASDLTMDNLTIVQLKSLTNEIKNPVLPAPVPETAIVSNNSSTWILTNLEEITKQRNLIYPENVNITMRIDAEKASWNTNEKRWYLMNGTIRRVENSGESFTIERFAQKSFDFIIDPPYYFEKQWYGVDAMTFDEGRKYIDKLIKSRQDYKGDMARYLSNFSYPLGMIFVVLAGIGIVDLSRRKISLVMNLIMSVALFVLYYLFFSIGIALAGKGNIPPTFGAYTGTIFFGIVSLYLYRKVKT